MKNIENHTCEHYKKKIINHYYTEITCKKGKSNCKKCKDYELEYYLKPKTLSKKNCRYFHWAGPYGEDKMCIKKMISCKHCQYYEKTSFLRNIFKGYIE